MICLVKNIRLTSNQVQTRMGLNMPLFETAQEWSEQFLCQGFTYAEQMYMLEKSGLQVFNH